MFNLDKVIHPMVNYGLDAALFRINAKNNSCCGTDGPVRQRVTQQKYGSIYISSRTALAVGLTSEGAFCDPLSISLSLKYFPKINVKYSGSG